ncbi:hypothetical protein N657DRAFT_669393 [Parathielavia appendiculata]|uniref:Mso1 N-terminal domain-containing protein n=1 Tax=Parathielavia appendiculata TaxID=2587402 RepID=A0AAN6U705_9PEZI|nr:hypothetical protein N657DRAFT_669393 [Parathielavia appendiculata]
MASWYKDLLTNASSYTTKLQRTYFGGESDGETEDDTLVCRVLRAYYSEKGQPLPGWLPPDPKVPPPQQPVFASQPQPQLGASGSQQRQGQPGQFVNSRNPFAGGGVDGQRPGMGGQRTGSLPGGGRGDAVSSPAGGGRSSAQEMLKQRLWGGARTASPNSGGPFQPPVQQQQQQQPPASAQQSGNRWGWGSGGNSGGGGDVGYGAQPGRRNDRPVMSANAPWADGGFDYPGGGGGGDIAPMLNTRIAHPAVGSSYDFAKRQASFAGQYRVSFTSIDDYQ